MKFPIISVLTPTHNRGKTFLPQTIESVANQREAGFVHEHIIIDDASTDKTRQVVAALSKKDKRIKYVRSKKKVKAAGALNLGFPKSKGQLIYPFDDDDLMMPLALQNGFDFFKAHPKVDWLYAFAMHIDEQNRLRFDRWSTKYYRSSKDMFWSLMYGNFVHGGTVMLRRKTISKVRGWELVLASQEYTMWLKLSHAGVKHSLLPQYQMLYRIHQKRESSVNGKNGVWAGVRQYQLKQYKTTEDEVLRKFDKLPVVRPIGY